MSVFNYRADIKTGVLGFDKNVELKFFINSVECQIEGFSNEENLRAFLDVIDIFIFHVDQLSIKLRDFLRLLQPQFKKNQGRGS